MDFTREPVIQTVITPRDGYRLVVRSSKTAGLEEHFVDAVEVVCFGTATFFRSIERPKPFIVPVSDYEVLEVREPRMVLKTPSVASQKPAEKPRLKIEAEKQKPVEKDELVEVGAEKSKQQPADGKQETKPDARTERRRERRRGFRKRRGRDELAPEGETPQPAEDQLQEEGFTELSDGISLTGEEREKMLSTAPLLSSILPPPTTLIRDDLDRLRGAYRDAFYDIEKEEEDSDNTEELFSEESLEFSEKEAGDDEVPQKEPFRQESEKEEEGIFPEDATNAKAYDE